MTFEDYCEIEPRLKELMALASDHRFSGHTRFCANEFWFGYGRTQSPSLKLRLTRLVGWNADTQDKRLHSQHAYNTCYDTIYNALPNCRHCGCISAASLGVVLASWQKVVEPS